MGQDKKETSMTTTTQQDYEQLVMVNLPVATFKTKKRKVNATLEKIMQLREELNKDLYAIPSERPIVNQPSVVYDVMRMFLERLDHEELWVVLLDIRCRIMQLVRLYVGTVNSSNVRPAEIFRQAIIDTANNIVMCHNHPAGDASPSSEDIAVTKTVKQAGELLDIRLLDHIIIGNNAYVSLKERGLFS
jgi:DNA repair protein RadC